MSPNKKHSSMKSQQKKTIAQTRSSARGSQDASSISTASLVPSQDKCGRCSVEVKDDTKGIQCDECLKWFHLKCTALKEAVYDTLEEGESKCGIKWSWVCANCEQNTISDPFPSTRPTNDMAKMLGKIDLLVSKITSLEEKIESLEKSNSQFVPTTSN